ncbi:MAG: hypothetical protein AB1705_12375, partial [Verrucomicrobiota bacterium]
MNAFDVKALVTGLCGAGLVAVAILIGSRGLAHFDPALVWYAVGSVLAAFAVGYRFTVWAQRPPSRMYFKRGAELLLKKVRFAKGARPHPGPLPQERGDDSSPKDVYDVADEITLPSPSPRPSPLGRGSDSA